MGRGDDHAARAPAREAGAAGPLHVAVVSTSAGYGGAEAYLSRLVRTLGAELRFTAFVSPRCAPRTHRDLRSAGAEVVAVPGLGRRPRARAIRALGALLRRERPDLVHANLTDQGDGIAPIVAARLSGRPAVATLHLVLPERAAWKERVSRATLAASAEVVAVSESVLAYLRGLGVAGTLVRHGVEAVAPLPDARERLGIPAGAFVVGGIGRLHEQKGWDVLCRAAGELRRRVPDAVVVVIGEGPLRGRLEPVAAAAGVQLVGFVDDAAALVGAFDVLAVPSRYEALGLVAVEAMHAGVPVVASRVGGLPEAVGEAGLLVPPEEPAALAQALVRLAEAPALRRELATRGRQRARSLFDVERMAGETRRVYAAACR